MRLSRCRKTSMFRGKPRSISCSLARYHISRLFSTASKTQLVSGITRAKALQQQLTILLTPYMIFLVNTTIALCTTVLANTEPWALKTQSCSGKADEEDGPTWWTAATQLVLWLQCNCLSSCRPLVFSSTDITSHSKMTRSLLQWQWCSPWGNCPASGLLEEEFLLPHPCLGLKFSASCLASSSTKLPRSLLCLNTSASSSPHPWKLFLEFASESVKMC